VNSKETDSAQQLESKLHNSPFQILSGFVITAHRYILCVPKSKREEDKCRYIWDTLGKYPDAEEESLHIRDEGKETDKAYLPWKNIEERREDL